MPAPLLAPTLRPLIEAHLGTPVQAVTCLHGGDINDVFRLDTSRGPFVLKVARQSRREPPLPNLFFVEVQGLHLLREARALPVPDVIAHADAVTPGHPAYLLMTYLPGADPTPAREEALGRGLAALHRTMGARFGGTAPNSFGRLEQVNTPASTAAEFFAESRLKPQLALAEGRLTPADHARFEKLLARLPDLIPAEVPALVHGDLWHGNVRFTPDGAALIDPAAAFSHREVDLAALALFGGLPERTVAAYREAFPLADGWRERQALWNLYPLLAHVNMFGGAYLGGLREALGRAETL